MNIFDCINSIYIHTIYANLMYKICHDIGDIVFILILLIIIYKISASYFINMKTIDNKQNKIQNDYMWKYETKEIPIEKEENKDGKTELESVACD